MGDLTVSSDVVHTGIVTMRLGLDTLTTDGSITLENTGVLNIEIPLDEALLGQTVLVFQDGTGFNVAPHATINILDDDLLPDENVSFTPTIGVVSSRIEFDDTVESGVFGFGVDRDDAVFLEGRLGAEFGAQISEKVSGFISGVAIRDFIDDVESVRLTSRELGTFRIAPFLRDDNRFELAAGLDVAVSETFSINVGYLGDFNEGYSGHSGRAPVRIGF